MKVAIAFAALILCAGVASCATAPGGDPVEEAYAAASKGYVAFAIGSNAIEAWRPDLTAVTEARKVKAWQALLTERDLYAVTGRTPPADLVAQADALRPAGF